MSTSLLLHIFGLVGFEYLKTTVEHGVIYFHIRKNPKKLRCPECNSHRLILKGTVTRLIKTVPFGNKPVVLSVTIQRVLCKDCGSLKQINLGFADPKKHYSRFFARYVLSLSKVMTIKDVASHLKVSWDTIKEIQKAYLGKHFSRPRLKDLTQIAIDEISIGKRHNYLTVVLDLATGVVVFIGEGKGSESLLPFWKKLRVAKANIEAVAIDMSPAYISAVQENLPDAKIIFDHFHIVKLINDRLSQLRRDVYREVKSFKKGEVLKGTRWLLLKNAENLDNNSNEKERLDEALKLNEPLAKAYYLKEDLRQIWMQKNKKDAESFLSAWVKRAASSGVKLIMSMANTIAAHRTGILAYYDYPISTGQLEGTNNKIKTMQRQAYGFRDREFFKLKIFAIHKSRYALIG